MDNNKIDQLLESFGEMKKLMDTLSWILLVKK